MTSMRLMPYFWVTWLLMVTLTASARACGGAVSSIHAQRAQYSTDLNSAECQAVAAQYARNDDSDDNLFRWEQCVSGSKDLEERVFRGFAR